MPRDFSRSGNVDPSQDNVINASKGRSIILQKYEGNDPNSIVIDEEVANLLKWLSLQQNITPEIALKKAVATAAYIHDITTNEGGKLLVQRKDNSISEIVLK